jgi:SecD/SecF fusion protein
MGDNNQVRISTNYGNESIDENIDAQIENMLYTSLKPMMNENVTEQMFVNRYVVEEGAYRVSTLDDTTTFGIQSSQKVGPTVADDIKTSAIWSILFALIAIALYILIRFRNIAFSAGAVVGLVHDVLFILGIYSIFYSIMPFSLEIDQSFIAAILTVIGYSINDTVVVFDRIRENVGLYPKRALNELINMSVNSTLSRTFSTSFSTALPLLAMFIFGGETIRGFVFAILLGVIVGTYSTIFIASPIAYDIQQKQAKKAQK